MCRNIRTLYNFDPPATPDEVHAAALQYVRKVSGSTKPSRANQGAFDHAVERIAEETRRLLETLTTSAPPKDRTVEFRKAKARWTARLEHEKGPDLHLRPGRAPPAQGPSR